MPAELPDWAALPEEEDAPTRKAYFDVYRPGYAAKEKIELGQAAATVFGRNPEGCNVLLDHPSISRRHSAVLHDGKGKLVLYDFGSTHGTFLEGVRIPNGEAVPLEHGFHVKFAESSRIYTLHIPGGEKTESMPPPPPPAAVAKKPVGPSVAFMPPPPRPGSSSSSSSAKPAAPVRSPASSPQDSKPLDKAVLQQLPMSFGGSRKTGGALSKQDMAAGIAEMMAAIQSGGAGESGGKRRRGGEGDDSGDDDEDDEEGFEEEEEGGGGAEDGGGDDEDDYGPRPPSTANGDSDDGGALPADDVALKYQIPMSHEVSLRGHHKNVTAVAMDPAGSRVAVGGKDYLVLLYDFGGMDRTGKAFRELEPEEGNPIVALSFSPTGDRFLVATGSSQPKVFNRDGVPQLQFVKGDPYLADMANTKGHTMSATAAQWHPNEKNIVMTASLDGTVRLWDLDGPRALADKLMCKKVIKVRSQRNLTVPVTSASYSPSGDYVAAGAQDGSIQVFSMKKTSWMRADILIRPGHSSEVTAVVFSPDGKTLATRGNDDMVKLWDLRIPSKPTLLKAIEGIMTYFDTSNVAFSPDGKVLCVGTNIMKTEGTGLLKFFEVAGPSTEPLLQIGVAPEASVIQVFWHPRIKQIVCGMSSGASKIFYNPTFSTKGALLSANRVRRTSDPSDFVAPGTTGKIHNPHALPMFRDEAHGRRKKIKIRQDPILSKKPEQPLNGPGAQGRISGVSGFTQFVMQNVGKQNTMREEDPREQILKFAEKAKGGMQLVGRAYKDTAPVTPLQAKTLEQEMEDVEKIQKDILKK